MRALELRRAGRSAWTLPPGRTKAGTGTEAERASGAGAGAESAKEAEKEKENVFVIGIGINRYLHQKTKKPGENETGSEIEKRNLHRKTTMSIFFVASRKWSPRRYAQENDYGPMHQKTTIGTFCTIRQNI